ncbi:hypothetical protein [Kitasatospora sp. NPDC087315]|uniref:hypothetical protein n=1 Tax=Kitasatospora sp. NPDC087315 TaxID=3364069 RepID=UPI0038180F39
MVPVDHGCEAPVHQATGPTGPTRAKEHGGAVPAKAVRPGRARAGYYSAGA